MRRIRSLLILVVSSVLFFLVTYAQAAFFTGGLIVGTFLPQYALITSIVVGVGSVILDATDEILSGSENLDTSAVIGKAGEATTNAVLTHKLSTFGQSMIYVST